LFRLCKSNVKARASQIGVTFHRKAFKSFFLMWIHSNKFIGNIMPVQFWADSARIQCLQTIVRFIFVN